MNVDLVARENCNTMFTYFVLFSFELGKQVNRQFRGLQDDTSSCLYDFTSRNSFLPHTVENEHLAPQSDLIWERDNPGTWTSSSIHKLTKWNYRKTDCFQRSLCFVLIIFAWLYLIYLTFRCFLGKKNKEHSKN